MNKNRDFEILKYTITEIVILCLFLTTIFWGFISKYLPFSKIIYQVIINIFDILPFIVFLVFGKIYIKKGQKINSLFIIANVLLFSFLLIFFTIINNGNFLDAILRLGVVFRFLPLCLLILSLDNTYKLKITSLFLKLVKYTFLIQLIIGVIQVIGGESAMKFFLPTVINESSTSQGVTALGEIFGTFANTIDYSFFLVASFSILIAFKTIKLKSIFTPIVVFLTLSSGSTAGFALTLISIYIFIETPNKKYLLTFAVVNFIILSFIYYSNFQPNLIELYSGLYNSRLGMILFTLPEFLNTSVINGFFGLGADKEVIYQIVSNFKNVPLIFIADQSVNALDDVYYVSTIIQNGIVGLILLLYIFYKIFKNSLSLISKENIKIKKLLIFLFFMIASGSLFNQILHVRSFSLLFWITIGILSVSNKHFIKTKYENTSN
mgnify:CR=1 FL=1